MALYSDTANYYPLYVHDGEIMKKLTQDVFNGMPKWVKSAGISGYGHLTYFSVTKNRLSTYGRQLEIGKITAADWPPIQNDYHEKLGYVACDTTDWQNSAIDREAV